MADIRDLLSALNAPPALGDFSAARAQPYLNTGIGTGGGMQLVMKDPQGVQQAANRWAASRRDDPFANLIWGDTVGGAQNALLNERARQVQIAMQQQQMAAQREREGRLQRMAEMEDATRREIAQKEYLARIAGATGRVAESNAEAWANQSRLRQLEQLRGGLGSQIGAGEEELRGLQEMLMGNANQVVAGNKDLAVREGPDGLPELYSPTNQADANMLRDVEARIFGGIPLGGEGPESLVDPRQQYFDIADALAQLQDQQKLVNRQYTSAAGRPTGMVDLSIFDQFTGGGAAPRSVGQTAAQLLQAAQARGAAYRLPPSGPTGYNDLGAIRRSTLRGVPAEGIAWDSVGRSAAPQQPRWTFDPASGSVVQTNWEPTREFTDDLRRRLAGTVY